MLGPIKPIRPILFPSSSWALGHLPSKCSSLLSHHSLMAEAKVSDKESAPSEEGKAPNLMERAKEEMQAMFHHDKPHLHDKETHGTSDEIDETTPADEVKGPGVFERMKEEVEAVVDAIHPKK